MGDPFAALDEPAPRFVGMSWLWYGMLGVLVLVTLIAASVPMGYFIPVLFLIVAWPTYVFVAVLWYLGSTFRRRTLRPRRVHWVPLAVIAATAFALECNAPMLVRYAASRPAMTAFAEAAQRDPDNVKDRRRVGLWPVDAVQSYPGGVRFIVRGTGFLDQGGFAFSEHGQPPVMGEDAYYHLHGDWYIWHHGW